MENLIVEVSQLENIIDEITQTENLKNEGSRMENLKDEVKIDPSEFSKVSEYNSDG